MNRPLNVLLIKRTFTASVLLAVACGCLTKCVKVKLNEHALLKEGPVIAGELLLCERANHRFPKELAEVRHLSALSKGRWRYDENSGGGFTLSSYTGWFGDRVAYVYAPTEPAASGWFLWREDREAERLTPPDPER